MGTLARIRENCYREVSMPAISRREFLKNAATHTAAAGLLATGALELRANPLGMPIGCQTWPVREMIAKDFPGTVKQLTEAGFQTIELCSPVSYAEFGFAGLAKYRGAELRKILSDAGVTCLSSHFGIKELRENQEGRIAWAKGQPKLASSRAFTMRTLSSRWLTASGPMTYCWTFSIPSWSSSSSRSPPSAAATTQRSISPSTLAASFPCMCKAGRRKPKK